MSDIDAFGLPTEDPTQAPEFASEEPQTTDTEIPAQEAEELYPGRPEPVETETEGRPRDPATGRFLPKQEPSQEQKPGETAEEQAARVYAGKYQDVDALEKGYRELRDLQRRTAERAKAHEQRVAEVEFHARQMEDAVRRSTEYVKSLQQQQQAPPQQPQFAYDEYGNQIQLPQVQPGMSPQQVQDLVESQLQERLAYEAQARQEQEWRQANYNQAKSAQTAFFEKHPEVVKDGDVDNDIANTILAFNEAWSAIDGSTFNLGSEESIGIAYEASKRPALQMVLSKNPAFMDDDEGMTLANALAEQIEQRGQTTQMAAQPTGRMQPRENTPFAERGSSPAPPQASPLDEFDEAVKAYRGVNRARGSKTFFGE